LLSVLGSVVLFCLLGNSLFAQKIELGGIAIEKNEIPIRKSLVVESQSNSDGEISVLVFKSDNNQYFAKAKNILTFRDEGGIQSEKAIIELYDKSGMLLWSSELNKLVSKCKISDNGKFCHVIVYKNEEMDLSEYLISFNKLGEEIYHESNISQVYPNSNCDATYYNKTIDGVNYLIFKDFESGINWREKICDDCFITSVSDAGENISISSTKSGLYSMDRTGKILWENNLLIGGQAKLSPKGEYLLKNHFGAFKIYNNGNGEYKYSVKTIEFKGYPINYIDACFIKNGGNKIVLVGHCGSKEERYKTISVFNVNGDHLKTVTFNQKASAFLVDCIDNVGESFDMYLYNKYITTVSYLE